jgi:hydrogenase-4 component F
MPMILVLLVTVPLLAAAAPRPVTEVLTAVTGLVTAGLALALVPAVSDHTVTAGHYLRADAVSVVFLAGHPRSCTPRPGVFSIGYHAAGPVGHPAAVRSTGRLHGVTC